MKNIDELFEKTLALVKKMWRNLKNSSKRRWLYCYKI